MSETYNEKRDRLRGEYIIRNNNRFPGKNLQNGDPVANMGDLTNRFGGPYSDPESDDTIENDENQANEDE
jgi:hypothetical protein